VNSWRRTSRRSHAERPADTVIRRDGLSRRPYPLGSDQDSVDRFGIVHWTAVVRSGIISTVTFSHAGQGA
jgi:hypothetical protein